MRDKRSQRQTNPGLRFLTGYRCIWYSWSNIGEQEGGEHSEGSYKVKEILSDDLNDMVIDDVKATEKNKIADLMKKWLKKNVKAKVI